MSLDVYLSRKTWTSYDGGKTHKEDEEELFWANITHNLGAMAEASGIYKPLWRPEELGITTAGKLIPFLKNGLDQLKAFPNHFERFSASNGWGTYAQFVPWVEKYLEACIEYPTAIVGVSR